MTYDFLVDTFATESLKVLSVWSLFRDEDLSVRPHPRDTRGRSVREQMVHQCISASARTFGSKECSTSTSVRPLCLKMRRGFCLYGATTLTLRGGWRLCGRPTMPGGWRRPRSSANRERGPGCLFAGSPTPPTTGGSKQRFCGNSVATSTAPTVRRRTQVDSCSTARRQSTLTQI